MEILQSKWQNGQIVEYNLYACKQYTNQSMVF
jgi:hypothetical protein